MQTTTTSDGVKIAYSDSGEGDTTLLLLPGWCSNRTVFSNLIPTLSKHYRVLSLDWRGHGDSGTPDFDFGSGELILDALAVIKAASADSIIPVSVAHAGWTAIRLKELLGNRIRKLVFIEWMVLGAPPQFVEVIKGMQRREGFSETLNFVLDKWINGLDNQSLIHFVKDEMGGYPFEMWCRAAKEIGQSFITYEGPLQAVSNMTDKPQTFHLYGQPDEPGYLADQREFAAIHPWFYVQKLDTKSHFPMFEKPEAVTNNIIEFIGRGTDEPIGSILPPVP